MTEEPLFQDSGIIQVRCPECNDQLPVTLLARVNQGALEVEPDMTEVWAHAWTHEGESDE